MREAAGDGRGGAVAPEGRGEEVAPEGRGEEEVPCGDRVMERVSSNGFGDTPLYAWGPCPLGCRVYSTRHRAGKPLNSWHTTAAGLACKTASIAGNYPPDSQMRRNSAPS